MELKYGQVWRLETQEEFDAFVKLKNEQGIGWSYCEWTFNKIKNSAGKNLRLNTSFAFGGLTVFSTDSAATHYGKDLLKGGTNMKTEVGQVCSFNNQELSEPKWRVVEREPKLGSRNDTLIVEQNTDTKELRLTTGCFTGTLDEFEAAVKRKPFGNKHRYDYEFYIERYKVKYPDYKKEVIYVVKLNDKVYYKGLTMITKNIEYAETMSKEDAETTKLNYGGTIEEIKV